MAGIRLVVREGGEFYEEGDYEVAFVPRIGEHLLHKLKHEDTLVRVLSVVQIADSDLNCIVVGEIIAHDAHLGSEPAEIAKIATNWTDTDDRAES
jgi:hypothetical protein